MRLHKFHVNVNPGRPALVYRTLPTDRECAVYCPTPVYIGTDSSVSEGTGMSISEGVSDIPLSPEIWVYNSGDSRITINVFIRRG